MGGPGSLVGGVGSGAGPAGGAGSLGGAATSAPVLITSLGGNALPSLLLWHSITSLAWSLPLSNSEILARSEPASTRVLKYSVRSKAKY